ncbi:conjugative transfer system coupling protein TraD [Enterovibrio norvegicus]|uniref:conjugative transfer system coupling protein TraD n=1 Tax=Enterovibrio norvegicus TaxID=188144 RepID=UPI00352F59E6
MNIEWTEDDYEDLYREAFELSAAKIWGAAGVYGLINGGYEASRYLMNSNIDSVPVGMQFSLFASGFCFTLLARRIHQALPILRRQHKLFSNHLVVEACEDTLKRVTKDHAYLGTGFTWGPEHATRMYRINSMPSARRKVKVPMMMRAIIKHDPEITEILGGEPYLIGVGDEEPVMVRHDFTRAHCLIVGLPGTGKTTFLKLLGYNKLESDPSVALLVLDPKKTPELRAGFKNKMANLGKPHRYYEFDPSRPSTSIRIDCLANYNNASELASRIVSVIPSGGSKGDAFITFCWERVNQVCQGMEYVQERPTLKKIRTNLREGLPHLLSRVLAAYFTKHHGQNWQGSLKSKMSALNSDALLGMVEYYKKVACQTHPDDVVSSLIDQFIQDPQKLRDRTGSLNAILEQLCSGALGELLSPPDDDDVEHHGKTMNIVDFTNLGGVLYMATDGLTDPTISGAVSKLVSAAVAGASANRYNFGNGEEPNVCYMIDEAHNAINEHMINTLAVGRQSGFELILATQSMPDFEDKVGKEVAERIKGLCANTFAFRCEDKVTREFVAEKIPEADLDSLTKTRMSGSHTGESLGEYSAGTGMRSEKKERPLFPAWAVGKLPNLQAICSLSNGETKIIRLPVEPKPEAA